MSRDELIEKVNNLNAKNTALHRRLTRLKNKVTEIKDEAHGEELNHMILELNKEFKVHESTLFDTSEERDLMVHLWNDQCENARRALHYGDRKSFRYQLSTYAFPHDVVAGTAKQPYALPCCYFTKPPRPLTIDSDPSSIFLHANISKGRKYLMLVTQWGCNTMQLQL